MRWLWFITISLLLFLTGLFTSWFFIWTFELILIDLTFTKLIKWDLSSFIGLRPIPYWIQITVWLTISTAIIRIFFLSTVYVGNHGMEPTIKSGDNILISKLKFGPRLPMTPLSFPLFQQFMPFTNKPSYCLKPALPYHRLNGFGNIKRGNLLAYNFPEGDSVLSGLENISYYAEKRLNQDKNISLNYGQVTYRPVDKREIEISRCIGLPGDTLAFQAGKILINNLSFEHDASRQLYLLSMKEDEITDELFYEFNIDPWDFKHLPEHGFVISLSSKNAEKIKIRYGLSTIRKISQNETFTNVQVFPHNPHYKWNVDHFGPVIVPRKQQMLNLNIENIGLYERLIRNYEGNLLSIKDSVIYINNIASKQYKVKMDYYFVVGDNRHMSRDSRHWGFLPEDHIIGKPWFICLSLSARQGKNRRINLDRMFDLVK